jgi:hypothetical protein
MVWYTIKGSAADIQRYKKAAFALGALKLAVTVRLNQNQTQPSTMTLLNKVKVCPLQEHHDISRGAFWLLKMAWIDSKVSDQGRHNPLLGPSRSENAFWNLRQEHGVQRLLQYGPCITRRHTTLRSTILYFG